MRRSTLFIHGTSYQLDAALDQEALRTSIVDALRRGGDFVSFTTAAAEQITVLVSAGIEVTLRSDSVPDDDDVDGGSHGPSAGGVPFVDNYLDWTDY